ncbi:hypothetical protein [Geodermatophilus sp. SYSU D00710]
MSDPDFPDRADADAKAWFYLDNRTDIEAWAALRADATPLLDRYLMALAPTFEELAEELDVELDIDDLEAGPWPRVGLWRPSWTHEGVADVSIVIQWDRARLLKPGPNEWPFTAVLMSGEQEDTERRRQIADALAPVRNKLQGEKAYRWPYWRYETTPAEATALDPEVLARTAVTSFRELWSTVAPILDALHPAGDED